MFGTEATAGLSSWADVAVLGGGGRVCLIVQRRPCEDWFVVVTHRRSAAAAHAWIEAHYQDVNWRSPAECTALVGRVRAASW